MIHLDRDKTNRTLSAIIIAVNQCIASKSIEFADRALVVDFDVLDVGDKTVNSE